MELNSYIEHTNVKPTATLNDIKKLCDEAKKYHFHAVCVNPCYVPIAIEELKDTNILVVATVGFPFGANTTETKVFEATKAIEDGADEIDMVINISAVKDKNYDYLVEEITQIRDAIKGKTLKVIVETAYLDEEELREVTKLCNLTFVNYIKTSTGYANRGVSIEDIKIINEEKNELLEIKASGGIKTKKQVLDLIDLGVSRIGTSSGISIMEEK